MAALTANRTTKSKDLGAIRRYQLAASQTIYAGSMVMLDSAGLARPAAASVSNNGVVGVATEKSTSGASDTIYVKVQEGTFLMAGTTLAQASVGDLVYAEDDQTVDETQGSNEPRAGFLVEIESASLGWVKMGIGIHA